MNLADVTRFVSARWDEDLIPRLIDYVRVPAKSPGMTLALTSTRPGGS